MYKNAPLERAVKGSFGGVSGSFGGRMSKGTDVQMLDWTNVRVAGSQPFENLSCFSIPRMQMSWWNLRRGLWMGGVQRLLWRAVSKGTAVQMLDCTNVRVAGSLPFENLNFFSIPCVQMSWNLHCFLLSCRGHYPLERLHACGFKTYYV